jgi:hypothetical protein
MASGIGLVIKIAADTKKAVGDIKDVNQALEGTGTSTDKAGKLFGALKGPALGALGAVAGAALGAAAAMVEFGKAAWEDHQEAQKLAFTLQKIPGITQDMIDANEAWITQTMFATHVVDTDLRVAVGQLAVATGDLAQAQQLAALAADVATGANMDYQSVVDMLAKAVAGNTNALERQMPWLDANKDGTVSLTEALDGLKGAYGGAAAEAAKNDPWTTIKLIFDEIKESLGQWILPLFTRLGDWFKDPANQKKIQEFIDKLGDMSYQLGEKLLPALERFLDWVGSPEGQQQMRDWARAAKTIADAIVAIADAMSKLKGVWDKIPAWMRNPAGWNMITKQSAAGVSFTMAGGAVPVTSASASVAVSRPVTINFNGLVTDPEGTARAVHRVVQGSDWRNGRTRARRVEPAW